MSDLERWRETLRARRERYRATHPSAEWADATWEASDCPACGGSGWVAETYEPGPDGSQLARAGRCVVCRPPKVETGPTLDGWRIDGVGEDIKQRMDYTLNRSLVVATTGTPKLLFFWGPPGVGKTHLARGILRERLLARESGQLWLASELIEWLRDTQGGQDHMPADQRGRLSERLDYIRRLRWLVIDDLGMERQTAWGLEQLETIIDRRYTDRSGLVVTSNFDPGQMTSPFSARIRSRLGDRSWGEVLSLAGLPDYRRRRVSA